MDTSNILGEKILSITILWNQSLGMVLFTITATVPGVFEIFAHKQHATQPLIHIPNNYFIVIGTFQRSKMIMMWYDGFVYKLSLEYHAHKIVFPSDVEAPLECNKVKRGDLHDSIPFGLFLKLFQH